MDLIALVNFNHVAAYGGFSQASRATGRSKATLSRHVRELEESLGVRLIERGSVSLRLTAEGSALRSRTERLLAEVSEAARDIAEGSAHPRGVLRVSAPVLFAHLAMGRVAAEFLARYPEVELEVSAEDRIVDLVTEGFDVVIRVDPRPDRDLVGRCFLKDHHIVVSPPSLSSDTTTERPSPTVVLSGAPAKATWSIADDERIKKVHTRAALRLSSLTMILDAVRAGAGAASLPQSIVADDLAAGRLVSWGQMVDREVEIWVLHTSGRLASPKVSAFVDFLCTAFEEGSRSWVSRGRYGPPSR